MLQEGEYNIQIGDEYHVVGGLRLLVQRWPKNKPSKDVKEGIKGLRQKHKEFEGDTKLTLSQIGLAIMSQRGKEECLIDYPSTEKYWTRYWRHFTFLIVTHMTLPGIILYLFASNG